MDYRISIIIPVYNVATYLREAMKSIISQSIGFEKLQIIAVDDCSTDESYTILSEYAELYSNVEIYCTEKNTGGAGTPRNIGLSHAKAPYVMFLDPDDFYDKEACEILYKKIMEIDAEIVCGCCSIVDKYGNNPSPIYPLTTEVIYSCPIQAVEVMKVMSGCWCHIVKREYICQNNIQFTPRGFGQDTAFLCKCIANPCRYVYIPRILLYYRQHDQSATNVLSESYFEKNIPSVIEVKEAFANHQEAYQFKLSSLSEYYWYKSVRAENIDDDGLKRIYREYKALFGYSSKYISTDEALVGLSMIGTENEELAAKYTLIVRKHLIESNWRQEHIRQMDKEISEQREHIRQMDKEISEQQTHIRQQDDIIRRHQERLISQLIDAIRQKEFGKALKICAARMMKSAMK